MTAAGPISTPCSGAAKPAPMRATSPSTYLELDGTDFRPLPFSERYAKLARMLAGAPEATNLCEHTADYDGSSLFEHACRLGLEGIVAKKRAARYRSGTCRSWVKVKNPEYERQRAGG
jgi:ATP-dependent DNA ligase